MTLPEYVIQDILKKFGPKIKAYLEAVGFFDVEGHCDEMKCLNTRVSSLEIWRSGTVAGLALLMILIGWGWVQPG